MLAAAATFWLVAVVCSGGACLVAVMTVHTWRAIRGAITAPILYQCCGLLSADSRPCVLPECHPDREHASEWQPSKPIDEPFAFRAPREVRLRWNPDTFDARDEYRAPPRSLAPHSSAGTAAARRQA